MWYFHSDVASISKTACNSGILHTTDACETVKKNHTLQAPSIVFLNWEWGQFNPKDLHKKKKRKKIFQNLQNPKPWGEGGSEFEGEFSVLYVYLYQSLWHYGQVYVNYRVIAMFV